MIVPTFKVAVVEVRDSIKNNLNSYFSATLAKEPDIVNIVSALIYFESGFNTNALGPPTSTAVGTGGYSYLNSSVIKSLLSNPATTPTQRINVEKGNQALGLMQVMGREMVKGAGVNGKCRLEIYRPDLASTIAINPGDDPITAFLGNSNIQKIILAGLIMLEGKYKAANYSNGFYYFTADKYRRTFSSRLQAGIAAYLGLGRSDLNGTTPNSYASNILGGDAYVKANGAGSTYVAGTISVRVSSRGPSTNGSNLSPIGITGCG